MSYRLRMSAEIGDWLAEVCAAEPVAAAELGAGLVVLAEAAELPGQPLVTDLSAELAAPTRAGDDPRYALDNAYRQLLEELAPLRRRALLASGQTTRQRYGVRHFDDGRPPEQFSEPLSAADQAAEDRRDAAAVARWQRIQGKVDAFCAAKDAAKAMYTAAEASLSVHAAIAEIESRGDLGGAVTAGASTGDEGVDELNRALTAAEATVRATLAQARQLLRQVRAASRPGGQNPDDDPTEVGQAAGEDAGTPVRGLLELRSDPLGADIRVLFAVEPPGTVTFLAVLDGADAISAHRDQAIELAGQLLTEIRDGSWPPPDAGNAGNGEVCFDDPATLLTTFFPGHGAAVRARAAELAELGTLARLRQDRELSIADVATVSGLPEHRVWEIEHGGLRSAELHEAAAYVRAIGGRLDMAAVFGPAERTGLT